MMLFVVRKTYFELAEKILLNFISFEKPCFNEVVDYRDGLLSNLVRYATIVLL